jgi:cytochrome c-type biogenesis protein CcsB
MGAAFLGCLAGLVLELFKRKGFFAMAMAKVGFAFTTACFVMPFVVGSNMGESVGKTSGILMTYWLWIHVNVVIFSYALIAASAVLGLIYLTARLWHWISPIETAIAPAGTQGGGSGASVPRYDTSFIENGRRDFLAALDGTNVIIMRLAFLFLGTGIVLGAVWADVSWGRPWGWDPKETFALVTWLVYLILIHVRFVSPASRGTATAWLSVLGCGIMLFNWIGVNYMLVGLHSYA